MIELALKSTFIFGLAAGTNAVMRRTSAAQRHAIWMLAFVSVPLLLLMPLLPIPAAAAIPVPAVTYGAPPGGGGMQPGLIDSLKLLWIAGSLILLLRLAFSFVWFRYRRGPITTPLTIGPFRPQIYLPRSAEQWPTALRKSVVLHEEAHTRRHDTLAQLYSQIVCALVWFQPLVWYAAKRAAEERERACDDLVLASGVDATLYAGHLLDIAREAVRIPAVAMGIGGTSGLEQRLRALTDRSLSRAVLTSRWRLALAASLACVLLGVSGLRAQQGDRVYKLGDPGVVGPKVTHQTKVRSSPNAQAQRITGDVTLSCEIGKDGKPRKIKVVEALDPELDKNAVEALGEWRFDPATKDGKPIVFAAEVKISFRFSSRPSWT